MARLRAVVGGGKEQVASRRKEVEAARLGHQTEVGLREEEKASGVASSLLLG